MIVQMDATTMAKASLDLTSLAIALGAIVGWLPNIAAVLSIIWFAINIYESKTYQSIISKLAFWRKK